MVTAFKAWLHTLSALIFFQCRVFKRSVRQMCVIVLPMSKWRYEIEAAVNSVVHNVSAIQATFIMQVAFKLIVNVLDDGLKTVEDQNKNK